MISRLLLLPLSFLFASCAGVTDVSHHDRVRGCVGQTKELARPMLLVKHSGYLLGGANDVMSRRHVQYGMMEPGTYRDPQIFARLPFGHPITIDAIEEEVYFDAYQTVVYGRTKFLPTGREVSFACVRAPLMYMKSESFPWEW